MLREWLLREWLLGVVAMLIDVAVGVLNKGGPGRRNTRRLARLLKNIKINHP